MVGIQAERGKKDEEGKEEDLKRLHRVTFQLRYGLRGLQSVELELSSCEFKPTERRERKHHIGDLCII